MRPVAPEASRAIERLERSIWRCDSIIDELLDFTRVLELSEQTTRLDGWLSELLNELEVPVGIEVERQLALADVEVLIDPDRLRRAIINLYDNACQAMLAAETASVARLTVSTGLHHGRIEIAIADTGPGIPKEMVANTGRPGAVMAASTRATMI